MWIATTRISKRPTIGFATKMLSVLRHRNATGSMKGLERQLKLEDRIVVSRTNWLTMGMSFQNKNAISSIHAIIRSSKRATSSIVTKGSLV